MEAYAALNSLLQTINQIQSHPRPPIYIEKQQVESLTQNIASLQEFLQGYRAVDYSDGLENRIADAAYAAEDLIESHVVDQILSTHGKKISSTDFLQDLQKVIEGMEFVKKEAMDCKGKMGVQIQHQQLQKSSSIPRISLRSSNKHMVGFDGVLYEVLDKLTGQECNRQIISFVGMGGIGKTTLAFNVYEHQIVVQHFDILAWVTVSQEYKIREIMLKLLILFEPEEMERLRELDENGLGDTLHKRLFGRRYLVVIDDIWDIDLWDWLKFFFPDNSNGSRVVITTRLSNLADQIDDSNIVKIDFQDEGNSWKLFCKHVIGEEDCPLELMEIGKKIVEKCKGLTLSISVVGGFLLKSEHTQEYWDYIAENLSSIVNLEDYEHCLRILCTSYHNLPVHLKPCFLYIGTYPEDRDIRVFDVILHWVAEGFVKPISGKSLEEAAVEYLKQLIERNLILIKDFKSDGKVKNFTIHDLLKDMCLREAQKPKFIRVLGKHSLSISERLNGKHRLFIGENTPPEEVVRALKLASPVCSLICYHGVVWGIDDTETSLSYSLRLLRLYRPLMESDKVEDIIQQVNLRIIALNALDQYRILPQSLDFGISRHCLSIMAQMS